MRQRLFSFTTNYLFFIICFCQADIAFVTVFGIFFGLFEESFCRIREGALQGREACFAHEEVAEVSCRRLGIKDEGVLTLFLQFRIIAPQMPVTGFDRPFFFELALTLANFQAVVDARCIADDQDGPL